ncbi:hypothetical protein I5Q34_08020 [Streptomyces sp. AV19]|uniref:dimethylarginine dimethylaminohydrolase family protein n=1 Tax=Streptomyces sp. AV19 TaxID=2793068 RepID=UPI0018FEF576|nr:arginine deiminase family protein [Streptomyces sp. AV19]MBH1934242.1 hypothetical protein [Streptomyces sp. AV19]MDG4533449.1 arginine deiminase family protein [Streptomyces sp. AV19]
MTGNPEAEYSRRPTAVVVHDPVRFGALDRLKAVAVEQLTDRFLFRDHPDIPRFASEYQAFAEAVTAAGIACVQVSDLVEDTPVILQALRGPNLMFTRDAAITLPWAPGVYLPSRMAKPIRRSETAVMSLVLERLGLRRVEWGGREDDCLEGGDAVPFARGRHRCLLVGYARRTTLSAVYRLGEALIPALADEIVAIELAPWRMNLDGGFLPVAEDVVVAHSPSVLSALLLDTTGSRPVDLFGMLREQEITIIDVSRDQSWLQQACNYLCLGNRTVIGYNMADDVVHRMRDAGLTVITIAGDELVKGRGGPRCMSRPVYQRLAARRSGRG